MEFNGKNMTWKEFQEYWKNKTTGAWHYDDADDTLYSQNKSKFSDAWMLAGPKYCKQHGLEYVDFNQKQNQVMVGGVHFIFALDESSSMGGRQWSDLMKAFQQTLTDVVKFSGTNSGNKVSVIKFESNYTVVYER